MKRFLHFGFLLMGFTFTVTQGLLIRELLVAFFGNELSIGLILGSWLLLEAIGSGLLGRLAGRWGRTAASFAVLQILFALFLPLCLYAASISRSLAGAIPGEGVGLIPIFYSSFLILAPLALVDGAMFAFGVRAYAHLTSNEVPSIGWVYVYEAVGGIGGGILFTFLFVPLLLSVQIALLLSVLNLLSASLILTSSYPSTRKRLLLSSLAVVLLLSTSLGLFLAPQVEEVQHWLAGQQWAGHNLVYSQNSVYGNVAVVRRETQYTFYADGIPILTAPVPDVVQSEEIVHFPMLFFPDRPRRALVLSGGVGGVLRELGKYPLEQIDYAELDPLLIEAVSEHATPLTVSELSDPRMRVEYVDGRLLVRNRSWELARQLGAGYDLVIVNLPYPSTLQLNRFYTLEFYQMVRELMTEHGILIISCPGSLSYVSDELRDLNTMLHHTLQGAFPYVRPIPGDSTTLWLASSSDELTAAQVGTLIGRWEERGLESNLLTAPYLRHRFDQRYLNWFWEALGDKERAGRPTINRDMHPVGLFYGLSYWNALFSPDLARVLALADGLDWRFLGPLFLGCGLAYLAVLKLTGRGKGAVIPIVIAATGFTGMTADLVFVFAFQTLYGYVYHWIGLIIAAFLAGLSLGGLVMTRRLGRKGREKSTLLMLELAFVLYWALLPIALITLYSGITRPLLFGSIQWILLFLNALAGFLVGSQFPLANQMWLKGRQDQEGTAGVLYASDLVGAFIGSIAVSVILIPLLGIVETCLVAAIVKLSSLLLATALPSR
jgi:spermidine synthase